MSQSLHDVILHTVDALGYDLVEVRRAGTGSRPLLDVRVDRRDGDRVSVEDCARVSRALETVIDDSGLAGERYVLEVSSPGVERPLRQAADWRRFAGRRASVNSPALGGRVEMDVLGIENSGGGEVAVLLDDRGAEHRIALDAIRDARLVLVWNQVRSKS